MSNPDREMTRIRRAPVPMDLCGMARAATILGDRWSLLILREAFYGITRFDDLKDDLAVSSATLTSRLRALVDDGLMIARPYRDANERTRKDYVLTDQGRSLAPILLMMMMWADQHLDKEPSPLDIVSSDTGEALRIVLTTSSGRIVDWDNVTTLIKMPNA